MHLHLDAAADASTATTATGPEQFRVGSIEHYSLRVCSARDRDTCADHDHANRPKCGAKENSKRTWPRQKGKQGFTRQ